MHPRQLVTATLLAACVANAAPQTAVATTADELAAAPKRAAGSDHAGTFLRICVAPDNLSGTPRPPPPARTVPDRATWHARPYKVFDNLHSFSTQEHSTEVGRKH